MVKFENPTNGRFYYMYIEKDLFDDMALVIVRGNKHSIIIRNYDFNCRNKIMEEIVRISNIREKRGYVRVL